MLNKIKKQLDEILVKDSDFDYVRDDICENNRKMLLILSIIFVIVISVLVLLGGVFRIAIEPEHLPAFVISDLFAFAVLLQIRRTSRQNYRTIMVSTYMAMAAMLFYGILVSYRTPEQYTVTFIALLGIMSMTFVVRPFKMGLVSAVSVIVCLTMSIFHKEESVRIPDMVNILSFSVLSYVGGFFTINMKVRGYVLDKLYEKEIEKGKQRLKVVEVEALKLLTAVRETYDMVVSVNLTQNTYKLISMESFVTRGDNIEGIFDEVIDIHTGKVVEEQRSLYYNTFSRQSLLDAHARGEKGVYLEYQQCDEDGIPHWLGTYTMFIADPYSTDVTEITISQNIDERIRKEMEHKTVLQEALLAAEKASKAKSDFLSRMSHDIRTPMNAVIGYAAIAKKHPDDKGLVQDSLNKILYSGEHLQGLINDVLDMSRIEAGKESLNTVPTSISEMLHSVLSIVQSQAVSKGLDLQVNADNIANQYVYADAQKIQRLLLNILGNAVKFTDNGGIISLKAEQSTSQRPEYAAYTFSIQDTGIGMSEEFQAHLFETFSQERTSTNSKQIGTGLGMAIAKSYVDMMDGTILVESEVGKGTKFVVKLEFKLQEEKDSASLNTGVSAISTELNDNMQEHNSFQGKNILLVEDNELNREIAKFMLEELEFKVDIACDGKEAVDILFACEDYKYHYILMDIQMPIMDGIEATGRIRKSQRAYLQSVPIIALTANAFHDDVERCLAAGMNAHIAKPFKLEDIISTLKKQ